MHLLNDETMQAICWTLIHSLWQGLLLAVFAGAIIMLTRKSKSVLRYNLLSGLFFLFIIIVAITFVNQLQVAAENHKINNVTLAINAEQINNITSQHADEISPEKNYFSTFVNYFNAHASLIVMIWFIILSAQCVRLIANAAYIQRIRYYKTHEAPLYWNQKLYKLAERLQIKKRVQLLQSEIVKVPVMVGFFKPMILFPFSLMSQLPPEQIEAVLLHELGHIKRKDYFVNLLQSFTEIIFFFNPGVLWVSSLIKDERENCCDDIAIDQTKSKKEFIHALVSFQEYNIGSKYALAFPGRKNHLLNRVKRIITNNNKALNNMEKISLAAGIVIISFVTIAFTQTQEKQEIKKVKATDIAQKTASVNDTVPDEKTSTAKFTYVTTIDGKEYRAHIVNDKVTKLYIDGKKVPDEKIGDYKEVTERIFIQAKADRDKLAAENVQLAEEREKLLAEQDRMNEDMNKAGADSIQKINKEKAELYEEQAMKRQLDAIAMQEENAKKANRVFHEQLTQHNAELMALVEELRKQQEVMKQEAKTMNEKDSKKQIELLNKQIIELKNEQIKIDQQRKKIDEMILNQDRGSLAAPADPLTPIKAVLRIQAATPKISIDPVLSIQPTLSLKPIEENKTLRLIINGLMDRKIISSKDDLSIVLNNETFIINDVVQSEQLHAEFKEKYLNGEKDRVIYSKHGGSTHVDVNINSGQMHLDGSEK